jgi:hypothetical protein
MEASSAARWLNSARAACQACMLAQIGLLDPSKLPERGVARLRQGKAAPPFDAWRPLRTGTGVMTRLPTGAEPWDGEVPQIDKPI